MDFVSKKILFGIAALLALGVDSGVMLNTKKRSRDESSISEALGIDEQRKKVVLIQKNSVADVPMNKELQPINVKFSDGRFLGISLEVAQTAGIFAEYYDRDHEHEGVDALAGEQTLDLSSKPTITREIFQSLLEPMNCIASLDNWKTKSDAQIAVVLYEKILRGQFQQLQEQFYHPRNAIRLVQASDYLNIKGLTSALLYRLIEQSNIKSHQQHQKAMTLLVKINNYCAGLVNSLGFGQGIYASVREGLSSLLRREVAPDQLKKTLFDEQAYAIAVRVYALQQLSLAGEVDDFYHKVHAGVSEGACVWERAQRTNFFIELAQLAATQVAHLPTMHAVASLLYGIDPASYLYIMLVLYYYRKFPTAPVIGVVYGDLLKKIAERLSWVNSKYAYLNLSSLGVNSHDFGVILPQLLVLLQVLLPGKVLKNLYLADNDLVGDLPDELSFLSELKLLDISRNRFQEVVPAALIKRNVTIVR